MSSKLDYLEYVRDVLGIKSLHGVPQAKVEIPKIPIVIYVEDFLNYNTNEKELLHKMLGALKVPLLQMQIFDLKDPVQITYEMRICLTDEKQTRSPIPPNEINTFSPRKLLQNAALKKVAWDDLQKVLLHFQPLA